MAWKGREGREGKREGRGRREGGEGPGLLGHVAQLPKDQQFFHQFYEIIPPFIKRKIERKFHSGTKHSGM